MQSFLFYIGMVYHKHIYSPVRKRYLLWKFRKDIEEVKRKYTESGTVFNGRPFIGATVKIHPFVKTHCDHDWDNSNVLLLTSPPKHTRTCKKCNKREIFSYGTAKWESADEA